MGSFSEPLSWILRIHICASLSDLSRPASARRLFFTFYVWRDFTGENLFSSMARVWAAWVWHDEGIAPSCCGVPASVAGRTPHPDKGRRIFNERGHARMFDFQHM
jgi:hypothetical protein